MTEQEVRKLGLDICNALKDCHEKGIIHRDIKPQNILKRGGTNVLVDFGESKMIKSQSSLSMRGTYDYMAPELLDGGKATESSDQYALGVTLRELVPDAAADFAAICAKAAAQAPSRRYASVDAMLDDLRRFLARKPVSANPPSPVRRFRLFARRNPLAASGIAAASIFLAAFVAALAVGYIRTSRALAATECEAASAAQSLAKVVVDINRLDSDKRETEITCALTAAEHLAARFPDNAEIADAVERLKSARAAHARFLERRGGSMHLQHRFRRPVVRPMTRPDP